MSDLCQFQHPRFARMYERISAESERRGTAAQRDRALADLTGRVIEVGAGNGMNFSHYPDTVDEVIAVEPEDRLRSLAELRRVLRSGGELRFFEHVRSASSLAGAFQDLVTPLWARAGGGCHLNRDTTADIRAAGFEIEELHRFSYRPLQFVPSHAHILGVARKPGSMA